MCDPISGTLAVLGVAQAGMSWYGKRKEADAINKANKEQYKDEKAYRARVRKQNYKQFRRDEQQLLTRESQELEAARLRDDDTSQQARAHLASLRAAQAEFGVGGVAAGEAQGEVKREEGEAKVASERNLIATIAQLNFQIAGLAPDEVPDPAKPAKVKGPGFLDLALGVGSAGLGGFQTNMNLTGNTVGQSYDAFKAGKTFDLSFFEANKAATTGVK